MADNPRNGKGRFLMDESGQQTVRLIAGEKTSGEPVFEEVLVEELPESGHYRVLATPGVVLGVAAGDVLKVDLSKHKFSLVSRGGNIAVHVYGPHSVADLLVPKIASLGGRMDGRAPGLTVFTISAAKGFTALEEVLNTFVASNPTMEWYYGNVYDEIDGVTPLNWWI